MTHIGRGALSESAAIEATNEELHREGLTASAVEAARAGQIWLLADAEGVVFAALAIEGGLTVCLEG